MASFYSGDHVGAVVLDIGAANTKMGWAGDDFPSSFFRSVCYLKGVYVVRTIGLILTHCGIRRLASCVVIFRRSYDNVAHPFCAPCPLQLVLAKYINLFIYSECCHSTQRK
jgi:hypothetical protein